MVTADWRDPSLPAGQAFAPRRSTRSAAKLASVFLAGASSCVNARQKRSARGRAARTADRNVRRASDCGPRGEGDEEQTKAHGNRKGRAIPPAGSRTLPAAAAPTGSGLRGDASEVSFRATGALLWNPGADKARPGRCWRLSLDLKSATRGQGARKLTPKRANRQHPCRLRVTGLKRAGEGLYIPLRPGHEEGPSVVGRFKSRAEGKTQGTDDQSFRYSVTPTPRRQVGRPPSTRSTHTFRLYKRMAGC